MNDYSVITAKSLAALNSVLTSKLRKKLLMATEVFIICGFFFLIYARYFVVVPGLAVRAIGTLALLLAFWVILILLDAYARSYDSDHEAYWLDAYTIVSDGKFDNDYLLAYIESRPGYEVLLRVGLSVASVTELARTRKNLKLPGADSISGLGASISFVPSNSAWTSFTALSKELFAGEEDLRNALFAVSAGEKEFTGTVEFVIAGEEDRKQAERWWTADALSKIKCIGKDWAYGDTYKLDRYSEDLTKTYHGVLDDVKTTMHADEINRIEAILSRVAETNVFVVGHPGAGVTDIINGLAERIKEGKTTAELAHKRPMLFSGSSLVSGSKEKSIFEQEFISTMNQAIHAGNVLLIFDEFAAFYTSAQALGSDVVSLLSPYLASASIQIVALCSIPEFHNLFEGSQALMARFERLIVDEPDHATVVSLISRMGAEMERRTGLTFTYPALLAIVDSAEQYITEGVMPDKAVDLLVDVSSNLMHDHDFFVSKDAILEFVKLKTKIPVGAIASDEKEKLEHLEEHLHRRVVGQGEAITAVANALRRVRSGIRNPNRPIGTFLFLGPTGVGKTETAKALAGAYFSDESSMMRLDMNQYKEGDSIGRLIGSYGSGKPGVLSSMVRDKKYGVLLLDEFEKASDSVKDLFLQILDEGIFVDANGDKVNARNIIFIATSNAGSDEIFKIVNEGGKLVDHKYTLINQLVGDGTLKPELINRFDGVILFEPLNKENIGKIAEIMLKKLQSRLREKGIDFVINKATIDTMVRIGYDPKFGARPMNRAIQDRVEGLIARKIIAGELPAGSKVELSEADLA